MLGGAVLCWATTERAGVGRPLDRSSCNSRVAKAVVLTHPPLRSVTARQRRSSCARWRSANQQSQRSPPQTLQQAAALIIALGTRQRQPSSHDHLDVCDPSIATGLAVRGASGAWHRDGRGAAMARRDNREYRMYLRAEQRRQRGCIAISLTARRGSVGVTRDDSVRGGVGRARRARFLRSAREVSLSVRPGRDEALRACRCLRRRRVPSHFKIIAHPGACGKPWAVP